ncbi:MAG: class I fructose-bisphosphate aldolase [Bacteroides sp.]|nr:MAG: class I fructose-bisphosphate aldolase [Bacteroides sp.]
MYNNALSFLRKKYNLLFDYKCKLIPKEKIFLPSKNFIDKVFLNSNRNNKVLNNLSFLYKNGRLGNTGYLSILPVDQGIEHSAGYSFSYNKDYFNPENIIKLAIESQCNGVASTFGVLSMVSRKYAHKIPFIVKINHNELLTYPNKYDQILFGTVKEAWNLGAIAIGATIYFGSQESKRQINDIANAFQYAHDLGMATILWCYTRNNEFIKNNIDYHNSADISSQAIHLGATIQADIIKQKIPSNNLHGFKNLNFGKFNNKMYNMIGDNPIDMCRYQIINSFSGMCPLLNSGGESKNESDDLYDALLLSVINKRAGGSGLIMGRKAFQKDIKEGIKIINYIQNIYLDDQITIA